MFQVGNIRWLGKGLWEVRYFLQQHAKKSWESQRFSKAKRLLEGALQNLCL